METHKIFIINSKKQVLLQKEVKEWRVAEELEKLNNLKRHYVKSLLEIDSLEMEQEEER